MCNNNYISKLVFENNSVYNQNTFIDLDLVSTRNEKIGVRIYPKIRVFFSIEGFIYIFVGNYSTYRVIQKYGLNGNIVSNDKEILKEIFEKSDNNSYYTFSNNELKFISNDIEKYKSWSLLFLENISNIYVSNKNSDINESVSGLNFSLFASDSDMSSNHIFRIDNTIFKKIPNMGLIINSNSIPDNIKIFYNNKYWLFPNNKYNLNNRIQKNNNTKDNNIEIKEKQLINNKDCNCSSKK